MNLGAFGVVIAGAARLGSVDLDDWAGFGRYAPGLASLLAIFFLSLAGIPPLAGWFAKLAMFQALIGMANGWGYSLATIAAINTVVALVYYLKVVKTAWFDQVPESVDVDEIAVSRQLMSPALQLALGITVIAVLVLGIFPGLVANLSSFTTDFLAGSF